MGHVIIISLIGFHGIVNSRNWGKKLTLKYELFYTHIALHHLWFIIYLLFLFTRNSRFLINIDRLFVQAINWKTIIFLRPWQMQTFKLFFSWFDNINSSSLIQNNIKRSRSSFAVQFKKSTDKYQPFVFLNCYVKRTTGTITLIFFYYKCIINVAKPIFDQSCVAYAKKYLKWNRRFYTHNFF